MHAIAATRFSQFTEAAAPEEADVANSRESERESEIFGQLAELRATWARLTLRVGINGPLYPLAEWLFFNWWSLTQECGDVNRQRHHDFLQRHNLRGASEGYALPDFLIVPAVHFTHLR